MLVHDRPLVDRDDGFRGWRFPTQGAVRPNSVVVTAPVLDDDLGLLEGIEDLAVEQLVSEPRVEAFTVAVLPRGARCDIGGPGADGGDPVAHRVGDELGAVVGADELRRTA